MSTCDVTTFRPCFASSPGGCYDDQSATLRCWIYIYIQLILGFLFMAIAKMLESGRSCICSFFLFRYKRTMEDAEEKEAKVNDDNDSKQLESKIKRVSFDHPDKIIESSDGDSEELSDTPHKEPLFHDLSITSLDESTPGLLRTHRSQSNFLKNNDDPTIIFPSTYSAEYEPLGEEKSVIWKHTYEALRENRDLQGIILTSVGTAFITSFFASILTMYLQHTSNMNDICPDEDYLEVKDWIVGNSLALKASLDHIKFFPLFLLVAYTGFLVDRWRSFLITCQAIQGRIHDIGLLSGSIPSVPVKESSKRLLYTIYRYLNVIHCLCYKRFSLSLQPLQIETDFVDKLRLLTREEAILLTSMKDKARDGLFTILTHAIDELSNDSNKTNLGPKYNNIHGKICDLRGQCSQLHQLFMRDNPNEYTIFMHGLVFLYSLFVLISFPLLIINNSIDGGNFGCIQPGTWFGAFFLVLSLNLPFLLFDQVRDPFDLDGGRIEVDNLIASTEHGLFQNTRALWHADPNYKEDTFFLARAGSANGILRKSTLSERTL